MDQNTNSSVPQPSNYPEFGQIAFTVLGLKLPLQVCKSAAGFYIGTLGSNTLDISAVPISRESCEYYRTFDAAKDALEKGSWTQFRFPTS